MDREDELQGIIDFLQKDKKQLQTKNKRLKKALKKYGQHLIGCESSMYSPSRPGLRYDCSCGLKQALKEK